MNDLDPFLEPVDAVADGVTALVGVTDEGLKGAQVELNRIADGLGGVVTAAAIIGTVIGQAAEKGKDGQDGKDGRDGNNAVGKQGPPGKDGRDGVDGVDGIDGVSKPGKAGIKGDPGARGLDGAPGPGPVRVVPERGFDQRIDFAQVYLDDGSQRRMAVRRDANRRFTELVRVAS